MLRAMVFKKNKVTIRMNKKKKYGLDTDWHFISVHEKRNGS